jgi:hypothetical protein
MSAEGPDCSEPHDFTAVFSPSSKGPRATRKVSGDIFVVSLVGAASDLEQLAIAPEAFYLPR